MRIGVNCFLLRPDVGGVRQYFMSLFNELLQRDRDNSYVFFHTRTNIPLLNELRSDAWRSSAVLIEDQPEIRRHAEKMDLYFCPFGSLWPRPVPLPCVVTLVDIQEVYHPEFFSPTDLYNRALHYPGSTRLAERVVTISEFSKATIARHHAIESGKILVAHLCPDPRFARPELHRGVPGVRLPSRFVFFPANHWPHKNHETLLRALARLRRDDGLQVPLVCTGEGRVANAYPLRERVAELGLEDQVAVLGYVSTEQLVAIMSRADLLVFPSLFEGFGIPLVEAMSTGCPIACANAASLPEIGGDAALYFDPRDEESMALTLARLWNDEALRAEFAERGRRRARRYGPESLAAIHTRAFEEAKAAYRPMAYPVKWVRHGLHVARTKLRYGG